MSFFHMHFQTIHFYAFCYNFTLIYSFKGCICSYIVRLMPFIHLSRDFWSCLLNITLLSHSRLLPPSTSSRLLHPHHFRLDVFLPLSPPLLSPSCPSCSQRCPARPPHPHSLFCCVSSSLPGFWLNKVSILEKCPPKYGLSSLSSLRVEWHFLPNVTVATPALIIEQGESITFMMPAWWQSHTWTHKPWECAPL